MKPILQPRRNCWAISPVRETGLLVDGRDYYRAFYEAAKRARRYILIAGWQFDSGVPLLRGRDARGIRGDVTLLPFLNRLCEANHRLRVFLLAWDFNVFYTLKREFLQAWWFNWKSNDRLQFRFDSCHPVGGCHHQKFAVIDGTVAFVGGMDLCWGYWDDRAHRVRHRFRVNANKKPYIPRHDVQSYHTGEAAQRLGRLFMQRWKVAGGTPVKLPRCPVKPISFEPTYPVAAGHVAISRTMGKTIRPRQGAMSEIRRLYEDAIASAEELIYIENQYFSSYSVYKALAKRMQARHRPRLRIVIVLPRQPEAFMEEIGLGTMQAKHLRWLTRIAARTRHTLGIYNSRAAGRRYRQTTYIHSKLMVVDDRFLTVGSANLTNRSLGFDSELNVSWEAVGPSQTRLRDSIRQIRVGLLAEHSGVHREEDLRRLARADGLIENLNMLSDDRRYRLRHHRISHTLLSEWFTSLTPHDLLIDPRKSQLTERLHTLLAGDRHNPFAKGIALLDHWLSAAKSR